MAASQSQYTVSLRELELTEIRGDNINTTQITQLQFALSGSQITIQCGIRTINIRQLQLGRGPRRRNNTVCRGRVEVESGIGTLCYHHHHHNNNIKVTI